MNRKPAVAGSFYPSNKEELISLIESCFLHEEFGPLELPRDSKRNFDKEIYGLISPHAGYIYSGPCASYGFLELYKNVPEDTTFIIFGPNHTGLGSEISIISEGYFETPLGKVRINSSVAKFILNSNLGIEEDELAHEEEHSIEVQLPFLQYIYGDKFQIVPIVVKSSSVTEEFALEFGYLLSEIRKKENIVVIASSDFTHYGLFYNYFPFGLRNIDKIKEDVKNMDMEAIKLIENLNIKKFIDFVEERNPTICGFAGIVFLMAYIKALNSKIRSRLLQYYTSNDIKPGGINFVSYASIVFYRKKNNG